MQTRRFTAPLSRPLETARGPIRERRGHLVAVGPEPGDGVETNGIGEATPLSGWTESPAACASALTSGRPARAVLDGLDPRATPAARHGVSLALADASSRADGRPLAAHLADGAGLSSPARSVPVNATIGDGSPTETAAAASRAVDGGTTCLKLKVGARSVDADVRRLRAVRDAVGPAVEVRADANGAWDLETARRALDRLEPMDLAYVEQPLPATELASTARLARESAVSIAVDESLAEHGVDAVLAADAADVVVLKPMALGGPDRTVDAAVRARAAGVEPVVTTTIDAVVARTAAVHVAAAIPNVSACGLATAGLLEEDLAADPCPVEAGWVSVPDGPGLAGDAFDGLVDSVGGHDRE